VDLGGYSKVVRVSELYGGRSVLEDSVNGRCKVIKMIGDKENNVEEIVEGIGCKCGCKTEIRNVVGLLMGKIYRLR
jgi:ferredoxin-fold anticodon binding domain-containing protein